MTTPSILNLGSLDEPVLLFGGPYSNLQATEALMRSAAALGIAAANIICTGDVVAYAGDPAATTDLVMGSGMQVVMGNCEESFGFEGDDCGCGFDAGSACDLLSRQWYAHANSTLTPAHRAWMRSLPRQIRFAMSGQHVAVIHGGIDDLSRWIFASTPAAIKRQEIATLAGSGAVDVVVGGHCGLPFADDLADVLWLNAGVIGMPANDGTARTWFTALTPVRDGIRVDLHALSYDHQAAADRMNSLHLAGAYAKTLVDGYWPNMDVLPEGERHQAGVAIMPWSIHHQSRARSAAE
ncbi:MAG: metallophosphoesterase family protein [Rhodospirillales bacterium]|nr:metallophosphoesterase family protein [Rhodospirillales bacterium]